MQTSQWIAKWYLHQYVQLSWPRKQDDSLPILNYRKGQNYTTQLIALFIHPYSNYRNDFFYINVVVMKIQNNVESWWIGVG